MSARFFNFSQETHDFSPSNMGDFSGNNNRFLEGLSCSTGTAGAPVNKRTGILAVPRNPDSPRGRKLQEPVKSRAFFFGTSQLRSCANWLVSPCPVKSQKKLRVVFPHPFLTKKMTTVSFKRVFPSFSHNLSAMFCSKSFRPKSRPGRKPPARKRR